MAQAHGMASGIGSIFEELFEYLGDRAESEALRQAVCDLGRVGMVDAEALIARYEAAADILEKVLWAARCPDDLLELYQRLYREMESGLESIGADPRHAFTLVIPVADRPQHLESCLNSLLTLCERFGYGGFANAKYRKISVLIADDSRKPVNIQRHRKLADLFTRKGLTSLYFGQAEQLRQLERLSPSQQQDLAAIVGELEPQAFYHKGASITRNIAYLKLAELASTEPARLFWFMDSDQEFCVNIPDRQQPVFAINYFQRLSRLFSKRDIQVFTGKVVGDPPVSPAVMAGNFLADVKTFVVEMAGLDPHQPCTFHRDNVQAVDQAAYHDMADLFGFKPADPARYSCSVSDIHEHTRCFADFAARLNRFFDGEHPTRRSYYVPQSLQDSIRPARTVYTGNYVLRAKALQFFIPFATLKLRMAGPVLGRILQARLGQRFVSANLPLLHKRTLDSLGQSEFRSGIDREAQQVDLVGEFERQFYGDVMLFTVERLCSLGYPCKPMDEAKVHELLNQTEASLRQKYMDKQGQIGSKLHELQELFRDSRHWWHQDPVCAQAIREFQRFLYNMQHNFAPNAPAYQRILSASQRRQRLQEILAAILRLPQDHSAWATALGLGR